MRILQLVEHLWIGGSERMAVNVSNVLQLAGHEIILCPTRDKGPLEKYVEPDVRIECLNKKSTLDFKAFVRLISIIRNNKIEIIHAHSSSVFWAVGARFFYPRIKIIWHDHYGARLEDKHLNKYYRYISPFLSGIITVNKSLREWAVKNMKVKPGNILFINNFPLVNAVNKNKNPDLIKIVCLANLRPEKDHPTLVRAIHLVKTKHPELHLKVILAGLYWEDEYYKKIVKLTEQFNLGSTIQIVGSIEDTSSLLATADIGVLCSVFEGMPLSLLEYGLAGLPVVVTNVGQCSEVVDHGRLGRVVPSQEPELFAEELQWIIDNNDTAINMGLMFKEHVEKEYGKSNFLSAYQKLLKSI
jgi:glycosyltransferase involved in cell wall biosynthesis